MSDPYQALRSQAIATFRFVVSIDDKAEAAFTECSVPVVEWETEEVKEGGLNTFTHQLPGRRKAARLTLKNGIGGKAFVNWCTKAMQEEFSRKKITISLRNAQQSEVASWTLLEAYPIKWTGPKLDPGDNAIAIETLEFVGGEVIVNSG